MLIINQIETKKKKKVKKIIVFENIENNFWHFMKTILNFNLLFYVFFMIFRIKKLELNVFSMYIYICPSWVGYPNR